MRGTEPQISWDGNKVVAEWPNGLRAETRCTSHWVREGFKEEYNEELAGICGRWVGLTHGQEVAAPDGDAGNNTIRVAVPRRFIGLAWRTAYCRLDQAGLVDRVAQAAPVIKPSVKEPQGVHGRRVVFKYATFDTQKVNTVSVPIVADADIPEEDRQKIAAFEVPQTRAGRIDMSEFNERLPVGYDMTRKRVQALVTIVHQYR